MKLALMQPYIFPYIGYFQLINMANSFVVYDDVNFIKQGWINRNNILVDGELKLFTIPLKNQSSFLKINEVYIDEKNYHIWKKKFLVTLEQSYKKAPFFNEAFNLINKVFEINPCNLTISKLATNSLLEICYYLQINTKIILTSAIYGNNHLSGKKRVIDICKNEHASHYINPIGGKELYDKDYFKNENLKLSFIKTIPFEYKQLNNEFVPNLSIIDIIMFNSIDETKELLKRYELL